MDDVKHFFDGKRVTILGLGLLGRGVGDAAFIASQGARVTVTDTKTEEELRSSVEQLGGYDITFHLGGHSEHDFTETDMVIKAAGVRLDSPEVAAARAAGVPVYMSTALAAKFAPEAGAKVVGVTGTRGKSTVAHMIHHALLATGKRSHLGGNVRGVSTLAMVPDIQSGDILVLELDSWQLQGFGDFQFSPHIAVFTNLMPDHLNYYPDMRTYFADKANMFLYQKPGDALFVGPSVARIISDAKPPIPPRTPAPAEWNLVMPGEHNRENAALAACALHALGLSEGEIASGLASFPGVEGRLQFVREIEGVKIYNDNNATTPEAVIAALRAFPAGRIVLIMGGADKGLDVKALAEEAKKRCKKVILLAGTGTEKIVPFLPDVPIVDSLESALVDARAAAHDGDTILFSPAFASFGLFKNEYDRNDRFVKLVSSL